MSKISLKFSFFWRPLSSSYSSLRSPSETRASEAISSLFHHLLSLNLRFSCCQPVPVALGRPGPYRSRRGQPARTLEVICRHRSVRRRPACIAEVQSISANPLICPPYYRSGNKKAHYTFRLKLFRGKQLQLPHN